MPYVHTSPALAFQSNVTGYVPSPVSLEEFATVEFTDEGGEEETDTETETERRRPDSRDQQRAAGGRRKRHQCFGSSSAGCCSSSRSCSGSRFSSSSGSGPFPATLRARCSASGRPPQSIEQVREQYGLDRPLYVQYLAYLRLVVVRGQPRHEHPVAASGHGGDLAPLPRDDRARASRRMIFAIIFGIPLGFFSAKRYGGVFDNAGLVGSLLGISIPIFFLALLLKWIFSVELGLFPTIGRQSAEINIDHPTNFYVLDGDPRARPGRDLGRDLAPHPAGDRARVDPARDHRAHHACGGARRPERGLRAHGARERPRPSDRRPPPHLPERDAPRRHDHRPPGRAPALRRDPDREGLRDPGHGLVARRRDRSYGDYPVLQGGILFVAVVFVLVNLFVDVTYGLIDPRVRHELMSRRRARVRRDPARAAERASGATRGGG